MGKQYSIFDDIKYQHSLMKKEKEESTALFAERLYNKQTEVYSANAMTDLYIPFGYLPQDVQNQWIEKAKKMSQ